MDELTRDIIITFDNPENAARCFEYLSLKFGFQTKIEDHVVIVRCILIYFAEVWELITCDYIESRDPLSLHLEQINFKPINGEQGTGN
ncbi:hypothetical protein PCC6912_50620 [Chlorogloeopsis fritschii PCC 6912]|uniref:Uncharacterized protein n=1 Tax=Chlorogloeopsis fritschii PCC 6912 TaxID=211165 RepID=A0A433N1L9_CHLFR|nr:hypothetical protein PCC6912_50620 [Chlorogloeopsis fritschii PCC 6912]